MGQGARAAALGLVGVGGIALWISSSTLHSPASLVSITPAAGWRPIGVASEVTPSAADEAEPGGAGDGLKTIQPDPIPEYSESANVTGTLLHQEVHDASLEPPSSAPPAAAEVRWFRSPHKHFSHPRRPADTSSPRTSPPSLPRVRRGTDVQASSQQPTFHPEEECLAAELGPPSPPPSAASLLLAQEAGSSVSLVPRGLAAQALARGLDSPLNSGILGDQHERHLPSGHLPSYDLVILILSSRRPELSPGKKRMALRRAWLRSEVGLGAPSSYPSLSASQRIWGDKGPPRCAVRHYFVMGGARRERLGGAGDLLMLPVNDDYRAISEKVGSRLPHCKIRCTL